MIFCGGEDKDEERKVLVRGIKGVLKDGREKAITITKERKEVIIESVPAYICAHSGLTEGAITYM
ncbi:hypothetical protein [Priestia aryabhattai]|uniref:hypothetical protein n=1 Tax=Priestia aryabhattai TaxID=412384 RepID=UPI0005EC89F6|nr:hypothetical protein [Priestia aryabhattai]KJL04350.1 hypothetical protein N178_12530 [Priestia aryabhattai B8W22]